jgi:hypothetical protein
MTATAPASQNNRILAVLLERLGEWVPMPELATAADCYAVHSRAADLRRDGYPVECHVERLGRVKKSFYRLSQTP